MRLTPELEAAAKVLGWPEWIENEVEFRIEAGTGQVRLLWETSGSRVPDAGYLPHGTNAVAPVLADRWLAELRLRAEKRQMFVTYSSGGGGDCAVYISQAHSGDEICVGTGDALLGAVVEAAIQFGEWEAKR